MSLPPERDYVVFYLDEWGYGQQYLVRRVRSRGAAVFKLFRLYSEAYGATFREFLRDVQPRARRAPC